LGILNANYVPGELSLVFLRRLTIVLDQKSISEIARLTSLSRNTIKRWLRAAPGRQPKYRRSEVATKLTPLAAALTKALETDAHRPRRERRTARALHAQLKAERIS
jgi:transposase